MGYGAILKFLARYWLHIAVVVALAVLAWRAYSWAYDNGVAAERTKWQAKEHKALLAAIAERDQALARMAAAQRKVDELAKLPPKVIERVRTSPSQCSLSPDVADELRRQVAAVNAAIREHNRNVSRAAGASGR